jgi:hypothetical protein
MTAKTFLADVSKSAFAQLLGYLIDVGLVSHYPLEEIIT